MAELATIVYAPLMIGLILAGDSSARELRPSDHGLVFQNFQPAAMDFSPEMRSFFNNDNSSPASTSSNVALPKAMNSSDASPPSWLSATSRGGGGGGDRVGKVLMVASLVCGIAGIILLVVSGLLFLVKNRKKKLNDSFQDENRDQDPNENNSDNKLQLVIRLP